MKEEKKNIEENGVKLTDEELEKVTGGAVNSASETNVTQALQCKVVGVPMTGSYQPSSDSAVELR